MLAARSILDLAGDLCLAGAGAGCLYLLFAAILVHRFPSKKEDCGDTLTAITVLVPLCGFEPGLDRRLSLLCQQNYAGPVQIICGTLDREDPATRVVDQLRASRARHAIECHVNTRSHGRNPKISNLINMASHARHDTLVMIDSDIEVDLDHLKKLAAELRKPGVGAVTCLYRGVAGEGIWARLAAMRINAEFLPNVIVALTTQLAYPCFGASIAIKRETLRRIGGLAAFADQLWDDYVIGEAVRDFGYEVVVAPFTVGHVYKTCIPRCWLADEFRAVCTIRDIDPIGHAGSAITYPMPLALIALMLNGGQPAIAVAFIATICRMALARTTYLRFNADSGAILLLPLRELLSFLIFVASFFASTVTWRGRRYRIPERTFIADPR